MSTYGPAYEEKIDGKRIQVQMDRIKGILLSAAGLNTWLTLSEINAMTGYPEASISAQLRHLRKKPFGSYIIEKRRRGGEKSALWEYQLRPPLTSQQENLFE